MDLPEIVSVAVRHHGRLLWLKRNDNQKWTMPGGHLNSGEEPIVGAARELNEEAGIDPNGGLVYLGSDVARNKYHVHAFVLDCEELPEVDVSKDPDQEACHFEWHEQLPDNDIAHVPHEHNVVLKLLNPLEKSENKKMWRSKDGISIPHHTNPARKDWDKSYRDSLVRVFGQGDPKRLQPVKIPISEHTSGNNSVVNKPRYNLYVRMLHGGDKLPPLVVRRNGLGWHVVDGNHRLAAALKAGHTQMEAYELVDPKKVQKTEDLEKGIGSALLSGALALGQLQEPPKANVDLLAAVKRAGIPTVQEGRWTPEGLHPDLIPIAHLESSFGRNMKHASGGDEYHTAHGAVGFKPMTAHEEYQRTPTLQKMYGDLKDPAEFTRKFKSDHQFYNLLASAHFARLKKIHGTPERGAFAWRWGSTAAKAAPDSQVNSDTYVQKYRNLALSSGVKKFEELEKNDKLVRQVQSNLSDDLRRAPWKGSDNCLAGHCYVASEALWHMMGGPESGYVPQSIQHEGGPHWYLKHKVTGKIIDPTAGQFKTPVPYEKGVGKGFLTKQPSKRAQVVIDRVIGKLNKMAIKDLRISRQPHGMDLKTTASREGAEVPYTYWGPTYNYSHLLPDAMRRDFRLTVIDGGWENGTHAVIHRFDGGDVHKEVGKVSGTIYPKSKVLDVGYSFIDPTHRKKGLGLAAYEALFAHAYHHHKTRKVMGHDHSTAAHGTHSALARKHNLEYVAESQYHGKPEKDFDAKYGQYEYTLKTELEKMAIKDLKPGPKLPSEHGMYRVDYSHLLPKKFRATHRLFAQHYDYPDVPTDFVGIRLVDKSTGDRVGRIDAGIEHDEEGRNVVTPSVTGISDPNLHGKGLGTAMYEALLGHVHHHLGIRRAAGSSHSSMAAGVHRKITVKHKVRGYNPEQVGEERGPNDNAYGDYSYYW